MFFHLFINEKQLSVDIYKYLSLFFGLGYD